MIREILADFLNMEGYVVHTVEDGAEALKELHQPQLQPGDLRSEDAQHGRPRADPEDHRGEHPGPHRDHDRLRHRRDRHRGDEEGRLRLHPQAVQGRGGHPHRAARAGSPAPAAREHPAQGRAVDLQDQRGHRDLAVGRDGAGPGAGRDASTTVDADVVSLLLEDPKREGHFIERMRKVVASAPSPACERAGAEPGRGAAAVPGGPPAAGARQPRRTASSPSPPHDLERRLVSFCSIPLKLNGRIIGMLNAYSYTRGNKFSEGQRKMLYVLGQPRRRLDRERAPLREPGRRQQGSDHAPTSRWRRTSSRPSSASPTRWRSRTATRAATRSGWRCTRA